jgi:O-antigen/teichoic acid export membrane protein
MKQRQILINALMSLAQVVVTGITLFVLYRFLLRAIGVEKLGVWSVVLATATIANIANLGISASVVKFVAKYLARSEEEKVLALIQTSTISVGIFIGCGLLAVYPLVGWVLRRVIPPAHLQDALSILPYALLSLWITIIASIFQAGLDGYQRIDHRSIVLTGGALVFLILCFIMVPVHGLMGLAYAQVINAAILLFGSWFMLRRHITRLPFFPRRWDRKLFREIVGYSINFQIVSILTMLYDPITKALITKFGGLSMAGYYDMASRMLMQVRSLIVSANQVLVPVVADLQETNPAHIRTVYRDSCRLLVYIAFPLYFIIIALSPIISELWIGRYESVFVLFSAMLSIGWLVNSLIAPAYFAYLGTGDLSWNVISHIAIGLLNAGLGFLLGTMYGGIAVVSAWVFSLIIGSCIIFISYHYKNKLPLTDPFPKENIAVFGASILGVFISIALYSFMHGIFAPLILLCTILVLYSATVALPIWRHPMRTRLSLWIHRYLLNEAQK